MQASGMSKSESAESLEIVMTFVSKFLGSDNANSVFLPIDNDPVDKCLPVHGSCMNLR
jgi:hypothetical protein